MAQLSTGDKCSWKWLVSAYKNTIRAFFISGHYASLVWWQGGAIGYKMGFHLWFIDSRVNGQMICLPNEEQCISGYGRFSSNIYVSDITLLHAQWNPFFSSSIHMQFSPTTNIFLKWLNTLLARIWLSSIHSWVQSEMPGWLTMRNEEFHCSGLTDCEFSSY